MSDSRILLGVGCDTEDLQRLKLVLERRPSFRERWYTAAEQREQHASRNPVARALDQFCLKEAAIKACWSWLQLTPSSIEALPGDGSLCVLPAAGHSIQLEWQLRHGANHASAEVLAFLPADRT